MGHTGHTRLRRGFGAQALGAALVATALLAVPAVVAAQPLPGRAIGANRGWQGNAVRDAYDRGYQEGLRRGEQDGRGGRAFDVGRDAGYRAGDRGYNRRYGDRNAYRNSYRVGFEDGYRTGFDRLRVVRTGQNGRRDSRVLTARGRGYQEPAFARGYSDGFEKGIEDGRDRDRYDPVRHSDYREADQGYSGSYGSKDAYKNNYRSGFRQGYEEGYRDATRSRR
jgi:hypothetical protein